jgi:ABC-2 type transport system ATP-binding protein
VIRATARHPLVPIALIGIAFCLGSAAVWRMPIRDVLVGGDTPLWVSLWVPAEPGREEVLAKLLRPLEAQLLAEPAVAGTRARVSASWLSVEVTTRHGYDQRVVAGSVRELAASVARSGPPGTISSVWRSGSSEDRPGLVMQLSGVESSAVERELLPRLRVTTGLRAVELFPAPNDGARLRLATPLPDAVAAVRAACRLASERRPLGWLGASGVVTAAPVTSLTQLLDAPVALGGAVLPLGDVARLEIPPLRQPVRYRVNGREGLLLLIRDDPAQPRRSALGVARRAVEAWVGARPGASTRVVFDAWHELLEALADIARAALIGAGLALFTVVVTLRRWRPALLVVATVPVTMALTIVALAVLGRGLDTVSVSALAIALGPMIGSIVVVGEMLATSHGATAVERAVAGARAAARPLMLTAGGVVAALLPAWLAVGADLGQLRAAALPLALALVLSIAVATALVPGLAAALGTPPRVPRPRRIAAIIKAACRDPLLALLAVLAPSVLVLAALGPKLIGGDLVSSGDPTFVMLSIELPGGATAELDRTLAVAESQIAAHRGVARVLAWVSENRARVGVKIKTNWSVGSRRTALLMEVDRALRVAQLGYHLDDRSQRVLRSSAPTEQQRLATLGVVISGDDPRAVDEAAATIATELGRSWTPPPASRGLVRLTPRQPGFDLAGHLAPPAAARVPIVLATRGRDLKLEVVGATDHERDEPAPLSVWLETPGSTGVVPAAVASHFIVEEAPWPERRDGAFVRRFELPVSDRQLMLDGLRAARVEMHARVRRATVPAGVSVVADPVEAEHERPPWLLAALLAVAVVLIVVGVGLESMLAPLRVITVLVPHLAGAVLALWLLQVKVNEAAILGGLVLLGIGIAAGVLLEDRALALRRAGSRPQCAAVRAGIERASIALATAVVAALVAAPLWFGGPVQLGRPFVAVLVGGMLLGTPSAIVLVPGFNALAARRPARRPIVWRGDGSDRVHLRSLSKRYGKVRALRDVSAVLEPGLVALLGPNGAGKTTLIRIAVGALDADTGDLWVNGVPRREDPEGWRALVGYLPQSQAAPMHLPAGLWLELWAGELGIARPRHAAEQALASLGIADLAERRIGELSGGQRRRVRVARALLRRPAILIADEPTTGLDPEARVDLRNLLAHMAKDRLVLLATHIPEDVAVACRRVLVLAEGRILLDGAVEDLLAQGRGKVHSRVLTDAELRSVPPGLAVVARTRTLDGVRVRYLTADSTDPGDEVEPTLEESYLWLLGRTTGWDNLRRFRR